MIATPTRQDTAYLRERLPTATMRRRIGVCFLIDDLGLGGTELQLLQLIEHIDRDAFEPVLCLLNGTSGNSHELEPKNCETIRLGVSKLSRPSTVQRLASFARLLRKRNIDVLQLFFPDSTYFGALAGRLAGVRGVIRTRRDLFFWVTRNQKRFGKYIDAIYNRYFIDAMISNCRACESAALASISVAPRLLSVIENGLDLESFTGIPPVSPPINGVIRLGCVAMLRPEKRLDVLLNAMHIMRDQGLDVELNIAGEGPERSALEDYVDKQGLKSSVRLRGRVSDIPAFLGSIDVAILCSETEGQSNALVEYMAAGRAVVATDVGGNRELIKHGVTGLLVPPKNAAALANAISELRMSPDHMCRMASAARATAVQRFSIAAMVRSHESLYRRICGQNAA